MKKQLALIISVATLAAACGGGGDSIELGIKRVALSLTFSEEDLAEPVAPNVITKIVPVTADAIAAPSSTPYVAPDIRSLFPTCGTAPDGAPPAVSVTRTVNDPPAIGRYLRHNDGRITISGAIPISLPYPPFSTWEIPAIEEEARPASEGTPFFVDPVPAGTDYILDLKKIIIPGFETVDRIRIGATDIKLLQRTTTSNGESTVFVPDPPIQLYVFGPENTEWRSAGVDTATNTSMLYQGKILSREVVDVCGKPIDTYRVEVRETVVNLTTGDVSGTPPDGDPSYLNYATQFGGLVVREDVLMTITTRDPASGVPAQATLDYVSTANDVAPSELFG